MAKKKKVEKSEMTVDEILDIIHTKHGEESAMCYKNGVNLNVETSSFGSLAIDAASGVGGIPKGRIIEIYGPESSGKTTICLTAIAEAQKEGSGKCAFIDTEHALDPHYASQLGVNMEKLIISQPDSGEEALEIAETLVKTGNIAMIIIDSVAALVPRAEIEGEMGASHVGLQARLMSQACRKISPLVKKNNSILIFTNQLRMKIGVMYGSPEVTSGGNALKFYASMRLDVRKTATKDSDGKAVTMGKKDDDKVKDCNTVRVKFVKNKVAPPFTIAETDIHFGSGFCFHSELFDLAVKANIIEKTGSWYKYDGESLGQGAPACIEALKADEDFSNSLYEFVKDYDPYVEEEENEELSALNEQLEELTGRQISLIEKMSNAKGKTLEKLTVKNCKLEKKIDKVEKQIENFNESL